jgi:hypothetical protein
LAATLGLLLGPGAAQAAEPPKDAAPKSTTVPLYVEGHRTHVDVDFVRPDGSVRRARFIVDTGGGAFILGEKLAKDIGAKPSGPVEEEEGQRFAPTAPPRARIGEMPLDLAEGEAILAIGQNGAGPGDSAEGLLPGRVLKRFQVILDYPAGRFTLARPGTLTPRGTRLPSPIHPKSGFPRIEIEVDGEPHGFLLDSGATFTMVAQALVGRWQTRHPEWRHTTGAVGLANMMGGKERPCSASRPSPGGRSGSRRWGSSRVLQEFSSNGCPR